MDHIKQYVPVEAVTTGPAHHFFGYYNITPWDVTGRYLLALETTFCDRPPRASDVAQLGLIDTASGNSWQMLSTTRGWNWQMGCMAQWLPAQTSPQVIFNDVVDGRAVTQIYDVASKKTRTLPNAFYTISHDGTQALTLNFARVHRNRAGYGYIALDDPSCTKKITDDDGVYHLDLRAGESRLIISLAQLAELRPLKSMRNSAHWVNHLQFNTDDSRFLFLHRWRVDGNACSNFLHRAWRKACFLVGRGHLLPRVRWTRTLTALPDGSDIRIVGDEAAFSHYDWRDPEHVVAWANIPEQGAHYYLFNDSNNTRTTLSPEILTRDGHCTYSPDRNWILSDTYPDPRTQNRTLFLYHPISQKRVDIGEFYSPPDIKGEIRCDLHPRWNRDGTKVCFDSVHEGSRQVYVADVSEIVRNES